MAEEHTCSEDASFVFLCYSHADASHVHADAEWLEANGVSVWFDSGISAGSVWRAEVGEKLEAASAVLFYISEHSVDSQHCNREINLAIDENKEIVPIYLADVLLPPDLKVGLSRLHALYPRKDQDYRRRLLAKVGTPARNTETAPPSKSNMKSRRWLAPIAAGTGLLLLLGIGTALYYRDSIFLALALHFPSLFFGEPVNQDLGFAQSADGTRIAYATSGEGPPILHVLTMFTHLESGQNSPLYDNEGLVAMSSQSHFFVRYDGRGAGLSDRNVSDFSLSARVSDIEAVVKAVGLEKFGILAVSAGGQAAIAYTARHPERVERLVLAGTTAAYNWVSDEDRVAYEQMLKLYEIGWERPEVRAIQASLFLGPDSDPVQQRFVAELLRRSMDGPAVAGMIRASLAIDVRNEAKTIRVPTLVLQARDDNVHPLEVGRELASIIPGAKLEIVEGGHAASSASTAKTRRLALQFLEGGASQAKPESSQ